MDYLKGLKENVIMGRLIPAGTGLDTYRQIEIKNKIRMNEEGEEDDYANPFAMGGESSGMSA